MVTYILQRLGLALVTIWAISVVSFVIIQLPPGDFVDTYITNLASSGSAVGAAEAHLDAAVALAEDAGRR